MKTSDDIRAAVERKLHDMEKEIAKLGEVLELLDDLASDAAESEEVGHCTPPPPVEEPYAAKTNVHVLWPKGTRIVRDDGRGIVRARIHHWTPDFEYAEIEYEANGRRAMVGRGTLHTKWRARHEQT